MSRRLMLAMFGFNGVLLASDVIGVDIERLPTDVEPYFRRRTFNGK